MIYASFVQTYRKPIAVHLICGFSPVIPEVVLQFMPKGFYLTS